jgi:hypothetical protein
VNIKTPFIALGIILSLTVALAARDAAPVLSRADEAFLKDQARRVVDSARLPKGGSSGRWHNTTPYDLHVPGGNMGYPAYWVRDSIMMLGGDFIARPSSKAGSGSSFRL